jgi:two-component system chemotaxis sensor kinase CheA
VSGGDQEEGRTFVEGMDDIVEEFLVESHEMLDRLDADLVALEQEPASVELLSSVFRAIHTIKGTSGFLAFPRLEELAHAGENMLVRLRDGELALTPARTSVLLRMVDTLRALLASIEQSGGEGAVDVAPVVTDLGVALEPTAETPSEAPAPDVTATEVPALEVSALEVASSGTPAMDDAVRPDSPEPVEDPAEEGAEVRSVVADSTIRVDVTLLDELMVLVGELVLARNQIAQCIGRQTDGDLVRASQRLNLIAGELQEGVMKTRMQPIDHVWSKLPRVVRDLGLQCGKSVRVQMEGRDTELDRTLLEAVKDPLTHLVRNAVDHGIETPDVRLAAGKPAEGLLTLRARHDGGQVVVEVADDGAGIDPEKVGAKAIERGLVTAETLRGMAPADVLQLIFHPGFSTAAAVTNVSGRGVGMDVAKTNVEAIGGTIEIESVPGDGALCRLSIPLTLAIVPALTVECDAGRYAIPQIALQELVALAAEKAASAVEEVGGAPVYRLRGELLPLVRLGEVLGSARSEDGGSVVIAVLRSEGRRFGLVVDKVVNTEEIVVKPVGSHFDAIGMYSGSAVLGDGSVAMILDIKALARRALRAVTAERQVFQEAHASEAVAAVGGQRLLLAAVGDGRRVAIPIETVTRLEKMPRAAVERVGNREVVQYRGAILPIVRLDKHLGVRGGGDHEVLQVIVYAHGGRSVAIVVKEILDISDSEATVQSDIDDLGLLGSAVLDDKVTELLDVRAAILTADPAFYLDVRESPPGVPLPLVGD